MFDLTKPLPALNRAIAEKCNELEAKLKEVCDKLEVPMEIEEKEEVMKRPDVLSND